MHRLDRYFLSEIVGPLVLGFMIYTFVLLLRVLFRSADLIISSGVAVAAVGKLLLLSLPNVVVLTIPMALLFAILIAVGRLSSDSELVAIRASGISLFTLFRPILLLSALLTGLNILLMLEVVPEGNHALQRLQLEILSQDISREIQPRVPHTGWENRMLYIFESLPGANGWRGTFLADAIPGNEMRVDVAEWGKAEVADDGSRVVLSLRNAYIHQVDLRRPSDYNIVFHKESNLTLPASRGIQASTSVRRGLRESSLRDLQEAVSDPGCSATVRNLAWVEIHKKFSIPAACLVFGLLALPLGFTSAQGGRSSGFAISLVVILAYYVLLHLGEVFAGKGLAPPSVAVWFPNGVLLGFGAFLLTRRNRDKSLLLADLDRWIRERGWRRALSFNRLRKAALIRADTATAPTALVIRLPEMRLTSPSLLRTFFQMLLLVACSGLAIYIVADLALVHYTDRSFAVLYEIAPIIVLTATLVCFGLLSRLDRYVLRTFVQVLVLAACSGLALYIVADLTGIAENILRNDPPHHVVLAYYGYKSLAILYEIAPIIVLIATLVCFGLLSRSNEMTACKALGMSLYRLSIPVLLAAALVAGLCWLLEAEVLAVSNVRVDELKATIKGREPRPHRRADQRWLYGNHSGYLYNFSHYDEKRRELHRLQVFKFDRRYRLIDRLFVHRATYADDGWWTFSRGWTRSFEGKQEMAFRTFDEPRKELLPEPLEFFEGHQRLPEEMHYLELRDHIRDLKAFGSHDVPPLEVLLHNKIAYPVISLVMALVALPFAFRLGRRGALYGIGISLVLGIVLLIFLAFFTAMGNNAILPPLVAVWSPNVVFAIFSLYLFLGIRT
ncbi:MAG: YjgP/YjgQ family permease [bacterium]|nr:YjgP/YjgQ family permease [bacterium]